MYVFNADFLVLMSFEIITFKNILIAFFFSHSLKKFN